MPEEYILDPSAGPNGPGTVATDSSNGGTRSWYSTSSILLDDSDYAYTIGLDESASLSHYIKATNYSFNISSTSILGVKAEIKRQEDSAFDVNIFDDSVKLIKGGVITGNNKANTELAWPAGIPEFATYGGSSDLWGVTLTESDIEASNFGVAISVSCGSTCDASPEEVGVAAIDYIRMTVYYEVPPPSITLSLGGDSCNNDGIGSDCPVIGDICGEEELAENGGGTRW